MFYRSLYNSKSLKLSECVTGNGENGKLEGKGNEWGFTDPSRSS